MGYDLEIDDELYIELFKEEKKKNKVYESDLL